MRTRGFAAGSASPGRAILERVLDRGLTGAATRLLLVVIPIGLAWFLLTVLVDPLAAPTPSWVARVSAFPLDVLASIFTSLFAPARPAPSAPGRCRGLARHAAGGALPE